MKMNATNLIGTLCVRAPDSWYGWV